MSAISVFLCCRFLPYTSPGIGNWSGLITSGRAVPFVAGAFIVNILPFKSGSHTEILAALHLPIALWLAVGFAYSGARWRSHEQRMNYVRFSGEWFIYYVLIGLGGGVLMGFTIFIFEAIGFDAEIYRVSSWMLPCGVVGAVIISAWLVEAKKSIIENMAPVLTRLVHPAVHGPAFHLPC